jgi:hypothetical protein
VFSACFNALNTYSIVLVPPPNRQTLVSSGFVPQTYNSDELEAMGMYVLPHLLLLNVHVFLVATPWSSLK